MRLEMERYKMASGGTRATDRQNPGVSRMQQEREQAHQRVAFILSAPTNNMLHMTRNNYSLPTIFDGSLHLSDNSTPIRGDVVAYNIAEDLASFFKKKVDDIRDKTTDAPPPDKLQ